MRWSVFSPCLGWFCYRDGQQATRAEVQNRDFTDESALLKAITAKSLSIFLISDEPRFDASLNNPMLR